MSSDVPLASGNSVQADNELLSAILAYEPENESQSSTVSTATQAPRRAIPNTTADARRSNRARADAASSRVFSNALANPARSTQSVMDEAVADAATVRRGEIYNLVMVSAIGAISALFVSLALAAVRS